MVFRGDSERKEVPMVRVFIPWFPSSKAAWSLQLCSQQAFDLPLRPSLEFSFLLSVFLDVFCGKR